MYPMKLHFYKDLGIAGGRFTLVGCGAGAWLRGLLGEALECESRQRGFFANKLF
jgi:hypothetical protein